MARLYSQLFAVILLVLGLVGFFLGDAGHVVHHLAQGNLGSITLHLTYLRDGLDVLLALVLGYVGFIAGRHAGRLIVAAVGVFLLVLTVVGFIVGDNDASTKSIALLHFSTLINIFDLIAGVLAVLCALGTVEDEPPVSELRQSR